MSKKLAVVALGGNALLRGNQKGTNEEQNTNALDTLRNVLPLIKEGYSLVISHGNGPQVGNILMQHDAGASQYDIPAMPLDVCVADSQGSIAYMLERNLRNILKEEGIEKNIVSIVTQVVVDKNDPAFQNLTKRVGRVYNKQQADELAKEKGWVFKQNNAKDADAFRRVVASPKPIEIMNQSLIKELIEAGNIVIASGGGGIPVYYDEAGQIQPLEAVIDKDSASSLLAKEIKADEFYILTDVPFVYANYGKENQEVLEQLDAKDTRKHLENHTFGEGNMAPKIEAALSFVENGGTKAIITEAKQLGDKNVGTKITLEY